MNCARWVIRSQCASVCLSVSAFIADNTNIQMCSFLRQSICSFISLHDKHLEKDDLYSPLCGSMRLRMHHCKSDVVVANLSDFFKPGPIDMLLELSIQRVYSLHDATRARCPCSLCELRQTHTILSRPPRRLSFPLFQSFFARYFLLRWTSCIGTSHTT